MSDLKLYNLKTKKILKKHHETYQGIREYFEDNLFELLGVNIIFKDFQINVSNNDIIEVLGYDENFQLVVIEYRHGRFTSTINKGIVYLDFIKQNLSKLKTMLNEQLGYEISNNLKLEPRLIIIGNDFNQYDEYAIKQMPFMIDLIKYQFINKQFLIIEKSFQSKKLDHNSNIYKFKNQTELNLYKQISDFILSLGDEVCEVFEENFISYRKIKNFIYITFEDSLVINLLFNNYKKYKIKTVKDFEKIQKDIENCYDEN